VPERPTEVIALDADDAVAAIADGDHSGDVTIKALDPETLELPSPFALLCGSRQPVRRGCVRRWRRPGIGALRNPVGAARGT
jgi:hypothetical protein